MRDGRRRIRVATLLIVVAVCAVLLGLGVQAYRAWSPVRRYIRNRGPAIRGSRGSRRSRASLMAYHRRSSKRPIRSCSPRRKIRIPWFGPRRRRPCRAARPLRRGLPDPPGSHEGPRPASTGSRHLQPGEVCHARLAGGGHSPARSARRARDPRPAVRLEACRAAPTSTAGCKRNRGASSPRWRTWSARRRGLTGGVPWATS